MGVASDATAIGVLYRLLSFDPGAIALLSNLSKKIDGNLVQYLLNIGEINVGPVSRRIRQLPLDES
jgi:hypothetical protein